MSWYTDDGSPGGFTICATTAPDDLLRRRILARAAALTLLASSVRLLLEHRLEHDIAHTVVPSSAMPPSRRSAARTARPWVSA